LAVRKRTTAPADESSNFFVGIDNPIELRRQVLESSKKLVEVLKKYESFKERRAQKLMLVEKLKKNLADLNRLNAKLKVVMPKTNLRVPHQLLGIAADRPRPNLPRVEEKEEPQGEMERLEMELQNIESKLGKLRR